MTRRRGKVGRDPMRSFRIPADDLARLEAWAAAEHKNNVSAAILAAVRAALPETAAVEPDTEAARDAA